MEIISEEYVAENGEIKLVQKSVKKKEIPQDLLAVKLLVDNIKEENEDDIEMIKMRIKELLNE